MIIAIIILSIWAGLSLLLLKILGKTILLQHQTITEIQRYLNEIDFLDGGDLDKELILNEYKNATLLMSFMEGNDETVTIWDVSQYEKNKIIGLTTFGPSQWVDDAIEKIKEQIPELFDSMNVNELRQEISRNIAQDGMLYPGVDVYQMKDGSWLWRKTQ